MTDLRPYQIDAVERLERAIKALYVLPTGGGKTVVATNLIERAVQRGEQALVLTHRREILMQTSLTLPIEHGLILAGLNVDLEYPVQVASVQTLWARCMRTDKIPLPAADLIIIDEAHHVAARTWRLIIEAYPNARLIGLTATPCRSDGRGLGNFFDELIEGPQISELIAQKHLVPTIYYAPAEPDLRGVETRQGDYAINQLSDRMNRDDLVGDIVSNWHKLGAAPEDARVLCRRCAFRPRQRRVHQIRCPRRACRRRHTKAGARCNLSAISIRRNGIGVELHGVDRGLRSCRRLAASFSPARPSRLDYSGRWRDVGCGRLQARPI